MKTETEGDVIAFLREALETLDRYRRDAYGEDLGGVLVATAEEETAALASLEAQLKTARDDDEHAIARVKTLEAIVEQADVDLRRLYAERETADQRLVAHHDVTKMEAALNAMGRCLVCAEFDRSSSPPIEPYVESWHESLSTPTPSTEEPG